MVAIGPARIVPPPSIGRALARSHQAQLWQFVRPIASDAQGTAYRVPSLSRAGTEHVVVKWRRVSQETPTWELYTCSCEAGEAGMPACSHRAAVFQALCREHHGCTPVGLAGGASAAPAAPAAPAVEMRGPSRAEWRRLGPVSPFRRDPLWVTLPEEPAGLEAMRGG